MTPTTVPLLFSLLADPSLPIRLATSVALLRIVAKGLKEPEDKLSLFKVLSLGEVLEALEAKTRVRQLDSPDIDEGEESYREALGKLLNVLGLEVAKLTDVSTGCSRRFLQFLLTLIYQLGLSKRGNTSRGHQANETTFTPYAAILGRSV